MRQDPRIEVTPGIESGRIVFRIAGRDIDGLLGFTVLDGTNKLWEVNTSYVKGRKIIYGVLPNGDMAPSQIFPAPGVAPASIGGKTVTVRVDYQDHRGLGRLLQCHFEKSTQIRRGDQTVQPTGASRLARRQIRRQRRLAPVADLAVKCRSFEAI